jgi:pyruvate, water dikinase
LIVPCRDVDAAGRKAQEHHVGICGEAPANYPEIARFIVKLAIDSISVNPSSVARITAVVRETEAGLASCVSAPAAE